MTETNTHRLQRAGDLVRRVEYVCSKCGEEDTAKLIGDEPAPVAFNCWHCHAGRGLELDQMFQMNRGMFPKEAPAA